jgi:hypothetical protein
MNLKSIKIETKDNASDLTKIKVVENFGDARRLILQTMMQVRDGEIPVSVAMAMAANMKELNANIQMEINQVKVWLQAEEHGHGFGKMVKMGKNSIVSDETTIDENKKLENP